MLMRMSVKLEIRHLKLLSAVAESGSVTEAGKRLYLTQSALSHQLRDAEQKLGTSLFLRLGKKMVLTPAGEKLLTAAHSVLDELGKAESQVAGLNGGTRGIIRLSTQCYTCYHWLAPLLKKFHHKYRGIDLSIDVEATADPAEALLAGRLDVAIMCDPPPRRSKSLLVKPMFEDELVLVMSPTHRLTAANEVHTRDLAGEIVLCYPPREDSTLVNKIMRPAGVQPERIVEVPLTEAIIEMAAAGVGIGLLARWAVTPHVDLGRIAVRRLVNREVRRQWHAVTLRNQTAAPHLDEFLVLLAGFAPKHARLRP